MRYAPIVFATFIFAHFAIAQATKEVSVREPGVYDLTALFKRADRVALVKVTAGDSEAYTTAVYKAEVVKGFKGRSGGQTLFFRSLTLETNLWLGVHPLSPCECVEKPSSPKPPH